MSKNPKSNLGARVFKLELDTFLDMCCGVDTPRALTCYLLASHGEWIQYLALKMPDTELDSFADDYLVTEMMRKNPRLPIKIDTQEIARQNWYAAEASCGITNESLRAYMKGTFCLPRDVNTVLVRAQTIIANTLGTLTRAKLDFAEANFRFGPGATSSVKSRNVIPSKKMTCSMHVGHRLYPYWRSILGKMWMKQISDVEIRGYNEVTFVPKDAKTDRAIAIEPHLNIFVQLGQGALLRRQLRRAGIDLDKQADKNRALVRSAQKRELATIDLSSASDTIAEQLVWLLLPYDWASFLNVSRVDFSMVGDTEVKLEKFSSMGNGFTFELETLIFWALAKASGASVAVAFGDDIIVERQYADLLIRTLNSLGFSVNTRKTFLSGSFFESCGTDVWRGVDVRPCYFKGEYFDYTSAVIRIANKIRRYSHRRNNGYGCDARFYTAYRSCIFTDRRALGTCIDAASGDDGLISNRDEVTTRRPKGQLQGNIGVVWRGKALVSSFTDVTGAYLTALAWGSAKVTRTIEPVRGAMADFALKRQLIFDWRDLGPWI